jgi:hypothetical protein
MQQDLEQRMNHYKTRSTTETPEQEQRQKQIIARPSTEKRTLQHSTKRQIQIKPDNQRTRENKSRTKKSRRIVQRWARQRKQKELEWETRIQKTYDNNINQQKSSFNQLMLKKFGFIANASKPRWENTQQTLLQMPAEHYFNHQNNIAIHNLCKSTKEIPPEA